MINFNTFKKINFSMLFAGTILLSLLTLLFVTPYYETVLWGGIDLEEYFETNLQVHNQNLLIFSLIQIGFVLYLYLIKFNKFNLEIYHMISTIILSITTIIFNVISIINYLEVDKFYKGYDFTEINRLENFKVSNIWYVSNIFTHVFMVISAIGIIALAIISYLKYLEVKKNEV